jgi:lipopolysaccharide/colanic/teichoic acid biosynthesis glycosyltransferase
MVNTPPHAVTADHEQPPSPAVPQRATHRERDLRLKRYLDLLLAAVAVVVLSPVLLLIAIIIRADSRGPALFRQTRIGMGGRRFVMWKFRTMISDAPDTLHRDFVRPLVDGAARREADDAGSTRFYKLADDPRVTRVGRWLRKTSLDELPQLYNVLRGDMSLVGPRPPVIYEYEAYDTWQLERLEMPQGMTGLWQVSGRNAVSFRRMHELDVEYVRRWSPWLDLKILALTLRFGGAGKRTA